MNRWVNLKGIQKIYLIVLKVCNLQKAGECETSFNLIPDNQRKDVRNHIATYAWKYFNVVSYCFSKFAVYIKRIGIEYWKDRNAKLKQRKRFLKKNRKTLVPVCLLKNLIKLIAGSYANALYAHPFYIFSIKNCLHIFVNILKQKLGINEIIISKKARKFLENIKDFQQEEDRF